MNSIWRICSVFLIAISTLAGATTSVSAQDASPVAGESTFVSQLGGFTIDLGDSGDASFIPEQYWAPDEYEGPDGIYLQEDVAFRIGDAFVWVTIVDGDSSAASWNQESLEGLPYYGNGARLLGQDDDAGWMLNITTERLDIDVAVYNEYYDEKFGETDISIAIFGDSSELPVAIRWLQDNLTVEGETLLADTDLPEIEAMLDGTSDIQPVEIEMATTVVADWADFGLVSDSEWIDPEFNTSVNWDTDTLVFPFQDVEAIVQYEDDNSYSLRTTRSDFTSESYVNVGKNRVGWTAEDWAERWGSEQWLFDFGQGAIGLDHRFEGNSAAAVFTISSFANFETIIYIREARLMPNGSLVFHTVATTPDRAVDAYFESLQSVTIDGEIWEPTYTESELEAFVAEASRPEFSGGLNHAFNAVVTAESSRVRARSLSLTANH